MISKLTLVAGFGAGYVLGAKAGTGRYDQIVRQARNLMGKPAVQHVTSSVQTKVGDLADKAVDAVNSKVETITGDTGQPASVDLTTALGPHQH